MATLLSAQAVEARSGGRTLFTGLTFGIEDGERLGLIGPNGAGKSTLLKALAGMGELSAGTLSTRRGLQIGYVSQDEVFEGEQTVEQALFAALVGMNQDETEKMIAVEIALAQGGFPDRNQKAALLSGGWKKRLAVVQQLLREPDVLFLDEPTNHLDLKGVEWLEGILENPAFAFVVITHDRYFLDRTIDMVFSLEPGGNLRLYPGNYSVYLDHKKAEEAKELKAQKNKGKLPQATESNNPKVEAQPPKPNKLSFNEKREYDQLEAKIPQLEAEKAEIEQILSLNSPSGFGEVKKGWRLDRREGKEAEIQLSPGDEVCGGERDNG